MTIENSLKIRLSFPHTVIPACPESFLNVFLLWRRSARLATEEIDVDFLINPFSIKSPVPIFSDGFPTSGNDKIYIDYACPVAFQGQCTRACNLSNMIKQ
jgi:hypothetical protein